MRFRLLATALALAVPVAAAGDGCTPDGQVAVYGLSSTTDDLARVAELSGAMSPSSRLIRRGGSRSETACAEVAFPWPVFATPRIAPEDGDAEADHFSRVPARLLSTFNSTYPEGDNDGLLWSGRGLSQLASVGAAFRWRFLSLELAPEATWSENRFFDTVPTGRSGAQRFGNPYYVGSIDLPQRYGAGPFATWGPGQSHLRLDLWNVAVGVSTENLWIGPGIRNSILMSNSGPGFPHVFVGTSAPADIWIGKAEALAYWGRLDRTKFVAGGGQPLISGLAVTYEPRWIPQLYLGVHRYFVQTWAGLTPADWLAVFQPFPKSNLGTPSNPGGNNPNDNQIASAFARWVFPRVGLEIYGEWAREDHPWSWWSFVREPDHSEAYLLGFQKTFPVGTRLVRFQAELTNLQEMAGFASSFGLPVYYVHGNGLDLTNRGQLLGGWIGPGGSSQTIAVDVFHAGGRIGGYLERVRREDAYYWSVVEPTRPLWTHDTEVALGIRQALAVGAVEVSWEAAAGYRQNRDFMRDETNLRLVLGLTVPR